MLVEFGIVSLPIYLFLLQAIIFFGQFVLKEERVNIAARYGVWRIRERKGITAYKDVKIIQEEINIRQGEVISEDLSSLFLALADAVNDTLKVKAAITMKNTIIPEDNALDITAICVVDGSSWKISDSLYLLKKLFRIPENPYYTFGDTDEAPPFE